MQVKITPATPDQLKTKPTDESGLGFGTLFTDHIFLMEYERGLGWTNPRIEPYAELRLDPAAMVLHYGQGIFEGLKAYRGQEGGIYLFRPREYLARMNRSASRLCMPEVDPDLVLDAIGKLVTLDEEWVPSGEGTAMYIRPTMIAVEPQLGVRPSDKYLFYVIVGPVGPYYKEGVNPVRIWAEDKFIRAAQGGLGEAKTVANYAASLLAAEQAKKKGYTQVLWLDAKERRFVEEVGTMNMFFVMDDEVVTAPLSGTILPGVTRESVIRMVKDWGLKLDERFLTIQEVIEGAKSGRLKEAFGTGTAAVVSPVGEIAYKDDACTIADGAMGPLSRRLYEEIVGMQYGKREDTYGWRVKIA